MRKTLLAMIIASVHTFSVGGGNPVAGGNQDSTSLGGAANALNGLNRNVYTQMTSAGCPSGYDGEIAYSRTVVGGVAEAWREAYRSCQEGFYTIPDTKSRTVACSAGYTGSITQNQTETLSVS